MQKLKRMPLLLIMTISIFLASCLPSKNSVEPSTMTIPFSGLAGCGGGVERKISAKLEADYNQLLMSGKIGTNFEDIIRTVFDTNGASDEKYQKYLSCFQTIDERNRQDYKRQQCLNSCEQTEKNILNQKTVEYEQCISKGHGRCYSECATVWKLSKKQCTENCRMDNSHNIANWERRYSCQRPSLNTGSCRMDCFKL